MQPEVEEQPRDQDWTRLETALEALQAAVEDKDIREANRAAQKLDAALRRVTARSRQ